MRMKKRNKIRLFLSTCLVALAAVFCGVLFSAEQPVEANAATLSSTQYKTDGASVRVFKKGTNGYEETDRKGIRFHIEMGANYAYNGTTLLDTDSTNEMNGSYVLAEGYKTYTLVLPTEMLSGAETMTDEEKIDALWASEKTLKINTSQYWFSDSDGNWESVAYVYNIPTKKQTQVFSYCGVVCSVAEDGTETVVASTSDVAERCVAYVAKLAYLDTIDENSYYWGTQDMDKKAADELRKLFPIYNVTYAANDTTATEEVLWGEVPQKVPTGSFNTWYDETAHEEVDVTKEMEYATSQNITLTSTSAAYFTLTGVEYTDTGFNVYATLPTENFANNTTLEPKTIDMQKADGTKVSAKAVSVIVGGGAGLDAISKISLSFEEDFYTSIANGDTLTILKSSHFYNNGTLYELEKDYDFVYNKTESTSNWELPLGQIVQADIDTIVNYTEPGSNGVAEENIRVTFKSDFLVNGDATLSGKVYITRADGVTVDYIPDGYYYWNQGKNKILELPGTTDLWGETKGDVLTIEAGARLVQNNGYYVFQDTITATFNGASVWEFTTVTHEIDASAFTKAYTRQEGDSIYIDVTTAEQWADHQVKVVCNDGTITYHDTDNVTTLDPNEIFYHGENGNKVLRIHIDRFSVTGDWVTIPKDTEFWVGNQIYKLTEEVISYFVATNTNSWITNPTITPVGNADIVSMSWYQNPESGLQNIRYKTTSTWSKVANNRVIVDDTYIEGDGVVCEGTTYTQFYYYGDSNSLLELQGVTFGEEGGSVTVKEGTILWLFNNADASYTGAYKLSEDITIEVSGAAGSSIYKDEEVLSVTQDKFVSAVNDGSHGGEIRLHMASTAITGTYDFAKVEGSATINGNPTTTAFVYGYKEGTYTGNTIIAFTGEGFGGAFQAAAAGDRVKISDGTKIWINDGSGYIYVDGDIEYVYNGSAYVSADTQYTVTFDAGEATVAVNGAAADSATAYVGDEVVFSLEIPAGYELVSVANATDNGDGTYTTGALFASKTVTVTYATPIKLTQDSVRTLQAFSSDKKGFRIHLVQTDEINAITGGNYNIAFNGEVELKIAGELTNPTQYNYYGLIGETNHQILEVECDILSAISGDYLKIKAGSTFKFGSTVLLVESDIVCYVVGVTANFDENVCTLSMDGTQFSNGVAITKVVGTTSKITYGWKTGMQAQYDFTSLKINGDEQGVVGTYTVTLTGDTVIDVTTSLKTYTATVSASNATVSGLTNNQTITHGQSYSFTVSAPNGYQLTSVTIGGEEQGTGGSYSFTASGNTAIVVTTSLKTYTATVSASNATVSGLTNNQTITHGQTYSFTVSAPNGYQLTSVTIGGEEQGTGGSYSFTASGDTAIVVTTEAKTYTLTVSASNATVSGVTNNQTITHDQSYSFTVSPPNGYKVTSVTIGGVEQDIGDSYSFTASGDTAIVVTAKKLYAITWSNPTGATISVSANSSTLSSGGTIVEGTSISVTATASTGYRLKTVTIGGTAQSGVSTTHTGSSTFSYTVNAATVISVETVKMYKVSWTPTNATYTVTNVTTGATISSGTYVDTGTDISVKIEANSNYSITGVSINNSPVNGESGTYTHTVTNDTTITNTAERTSICIVEGTMILMADGTQKAVEEVQVGEMVLVFNHFKGTYDEKPVVVISHAEEPANITKILNLQFSNGKVLRIVGHHGLFDRTLNEYVMIDISNINEYIGHEFYSMEYDNNEFTGNDVTLTGYYLTEEYVRVFSPATAEFANYFAEGFLNAPPLHRNSLTSGHMNYFDFDKELKYDEIQVRADIEKYGLYTYEDFEGEISQEVFDVLSFKYFKIAIGKGLMTEEDIYGLIYELNNT